VSRSKSSSVALALVAAFLLLTACGCGSSTLSTKALSQESKSLKSLAAEGALLARDAQADKTTGTFRQVHSEYLYKAASKSSSSLSKAKAGPGAAQELQKLTKLAGELSADLKRLGGASNDELPGLARELENVTEKLE
jgi:hypothetical protein